MSWREKTAGSGGSTEAPPTGAHAANLVAVVNLGTHEETYQDETKEQHQIYLVWELCEEYQSGTKNRHVIGAKYTYSLHEKAKLAKLLGGWRGKAIAPGDSFNIESILGKPCLLSVGQGKSGYAQVDGASALPKGMKAAPPQRAPIITGVEEDNEIPDWLPYIYGESVADVCMRAKESGGSGVRPPANGKARAGVGAGANGAERPSSDPETPF
jgi:hypothetical protein